MLLEVRCWVFIVYCLLVYFLPGYVGLRQFLKVAILSAFIRLDEMVLNLFACIPLDCNITPNVMSIVPFRLGFIAYTLFLTSSRARDISKSTYRTAESLR